MSLWQIQKFSVATDDDVLLYVHVCMYIQLKLLLSVFDVAGISGKPFSFQFACICEDENKTKNKYQTSFYTVR